MSYVVLDNCIMCKHTDCVEVCPVDCFYEGENFLAINPDECIDCGLCEEECPVEAIAPEDNLDAAEAQRWLDINKKYSLIWPVITKKKDPMDDWEDWDGVPNKFDSHFSEEPGKK